MATQETPSANHVVQRRLESRLQSHPTTGAQSTQMGELGDGPNSTVRTGGEAFVMNTARMEFKNIAYDVKIKSTAWCRCGGRPPKKRIIDNVSGVIEPGDMVALMGASGAGKSTLLNVLSLRFAPTEGQVLINGIAAEKSPVIRHGSCFIQQEDLFFGYITVAEHLQQQAELRIPLPAAERNARVQEIMDRFSLNKSRGSLIGNVAQGAVRGISGGEKKRLSVATELLTNPPLIFADEPTSGLDAFMAANVVEALKALADTGHTVISTIHQPSSDVFAMFTKLLLLAEGRVIFYGPRLAAIPYFLRLGYPCPPYTNPADHFIELLAIDWENPAPKLEEIVRLQEIWKNTSEAFLHEWDTELKDKFTSSLEETSCRLQCHTLPIGDSKSTEIDGPLLQTTGNTPSSPTPSGQERPFMVPLNENGEPKNVSVWRAIATVFMRCVISTARNPAIVRARLIQTVVTALLGGLVYFRLGETRFYSKAGACFFIMVNLGFVMTFSSMTTFMGDKTIVIRERDTGLYSLGTFFWSKILSDMLFQFYLPVLYSIICWYLMGLNDSFPRFLLGTLYMFLICFAVSSMGYIIAAISKHLGIAVALGPVLLLPLLMVSGFIIPEPVLPRFMKWLYHISPFTYAFSGIMRAVFLGTTFNLGATFNLGTMLKPTDDSDIPDTGNKVLKKYAVSIDPNRWIVDVTALLVWIVVGRFVAMFLFSLCNRRRRR